MAKDSPARIDAAKVWSLNYRMFSAILVSVAPRLEDMGLEAKELFMLAAIDEHPNPAALAETLCMPKPTVTVYLKRLVEAEFVKREIDPEDLRRHRLTLTSNGRKVMTRGMALLADAFGARLAKLNAAEQAQLEVLLHKLS